MTFAGTAGQMVDRMVEMTPIELAIDILRRRLNEYRFRCRSEQELQRQVVDTLGRTLPEAWVDTEVRDKAGRFDVLIKLNGLSLVLELKTARWSAKTVERQAIRYAMSFGVDAVVIVTTSHRLCAILGRHGNTLGGKPFHTIALRGV